MLRGITLRWVLIGSPSLVVAVFLLFGSRYDVHGGVLGRFVDYWLNLRHQNLVRERRKAISTPYPVVDTRARHKHVGYSRYLEEMLTSRHLLYQNSSINRPSVVDTSHDTPEPLSQRMCYVGCSPSWLCQRCLSYGEYGSFEACSNICPECYRHEVCDARWVRPSSISVDSLPVPNEDNHIPPRIHQVYIGEVLTHQYPELDCLRTGWQTNQMEYRSYDGVAQMEAYVRRFAPSIVGAFQKLSMDFKVYAFKLILLFREGGVVVDIGWMFSPGIMQVLKSEQNMSLMLAKDPRYGEHCVTHGLLGAVSGHPLLATVLQQVLDDNLLNETTESCRHTHLARGNREEYETGACFLGLSFNRYLEQADERPILPGTTRSKNGDIKVLLLSTHDTGASRCTDIDTNLLVASKDLLGVTTRIDDLRRSLQSSLPHERGQP